MHTRSSSKKQMSVAEAAETLLSIRKNIECKKVQPLVSKRMATRSKSNCSLIQPTNLCNEFVEEEDEKSFSDSNTASSISSEESQESSRMTTRSMSKDIQKVQDNLMNAVVYLENIKRSAL